MKITLMDFSGIYETEDFWKKEEIQRKNFQDISGTNCYCDQDAMAEIRSRMEGLPLEGIHFIDSGNYHYISRIWLEKIQQPFRLLVFDNHTDMQPPAFGGLLSCGGWIRSALEELPLLQEVFLVGPKEEDFLQEEKEIREKVRFLGKEILEEIRGKGFDHISPSRREETSLFSEGIFADLPLYISIDKDILCQEEVRTSWSQGDMRLLELLHLCQRALFPFLEKGGCLLGVDVCGEWDGPEAAYSSGNNRANKEILRFFKNLNEKGSIRNEK